ncbi:MAG: UDP-glucose 4-epimerase GalE [Legionellaceae bacterium]|nr:UDP-glucose 4-epimerase GalE [Legionellaceae bacterium]
MRLLVTGAAGYIGSHFCIAALKAGHELFLLDNLSNGSEAAIEYIQHQAETSDKAIFFKQDIRDKDALDSLFKKHTSIDAVVHFAALKNAPKSLSEPIDYYQNNVLGTLNLLDAMTKAGVKRFVFSSTAAVYAPDAEQPCSEEAAIDPVTPYGKSKLMSETMLSDMVAAYPEIRAVAFRYFNAAGSDGSEALTALLLGDADASLLSSILKVAHGKKPHLSVYGHDYDSLDGTGIRDYIHVLDLADAHLRGLDFMEHHDGFQLFNLGSGQGYSVLETVKCFEKINNISIPIQYEARRPGDLFEVYADTTRARQALSWKPVCDLERIVGDVYVN